MMLFQNDEGRTRVDAIAASLPATEPAGVPVPMYRLRDARLVWFNRRAARRTAVMGPGGRPVPLTPEHLLERCAFAGESLLGGPQQRAPDTVGHADRYGGFGIQANGGSGRAALVNGWLVKGIGRTPLIGPGADHFHSNGQAVVAEALREALFGEVFGAEFPGGATPILAIIDTGLDTADAGVHLGNKRALVIRQPVLRCAHFERAPFYRTGNPHEGALDARRVAMAFDALRDAVGEVALPARFQQFWTRWGQQFGYGFAHRLAPGAAVSSNVTLDGRLLDFGASSALPSWARARVVGTFPEFGFESETAQATLDELAYYMHRFSGAGVDATALARQARSEFRAAYDTTFKCELLRLLGVRTDAALRLAAEAPDLDKAVDAALAHYRHDRFDIFQGMPALSRAWDLEQAWRDGPPAHLAGLGALVRHVVPPAEHGTAARRSGFMAETRSAAFKVELERDIYRMLGDGPGMSLARIDAFMGERLALLRRDTRRPDLRDDVEGFAVASDRTWLLCRRAGSARLTAHVEHPEAGEEADGLAVLEVHPRGFRAQSPRGVVDVTADMRVMPESQA